MSDVLDGYDEVVQMQLQEFQRHILGATNADLCIIIVEHNDVAHCATGSTKFGEADGKARAVALIVQTGAGLIESNSGGKFELLLRDKRDGTVGNVGRNVLAITVPS
jgi:hypothetical protein